jgi:hypothetical protein
LASVQEGLSAGAKAEKKPKVTNSQAWPADTHITLQLDGNLSLKVQKPLIRAVFRLAFIHLYAKLLFEDAFPSACKRVQFSHDALYSAATDLKHKNMCERLRSDLDYTDILGKIVSVSNNAFVVYLIASSRSRDALALFVTL